LSELFYEELFYAWIHVSDRWIEAFLERASSTIHMISLDQFEYDDIEKGIIIQKLNDRKFYEVAKLLDFKIGQRSRERRQYVGCSYPEPAFNTNIVPIVFNCDDKFVKYLSVTLQSIIANASSNYNYDIIILNTDINEKKQSVLTRFYKQHPNVSIRFYNMERISQEFGIENYTTSNNHVTTVAYYRLFIETVFKNYNKIIYLDSDIIVKDDISRFINVDLDNFACAAVRDSLISRLSDRDEYKFKGFCEYSETVLGLDNLTNYFNSGVMLFNVKRLIENNYQEKLIDVARKNNKYFNDQNVLNSVLQHDVKIIETTWNAQLNSGFFGGLVDVQPFEDLHILHYCSQIKPWKDSSVEFADVWWGYARQTPFYEVLIAELCEAEDNVNKLLVTDHMVQVLKNGFFKKVKKYKDGKKMTRYFGGIFKKIKSIQSKKYYLLGVQVWHKKR
jgi:lipopolysaccharide biosynthesis glycosyltransferase